MAAAAILTFLDSHCEVNVEWLQPMLQRVKEVSHPSQGERGVLESLLPGSWCEGGETGAEPRWCPRKPQWSASQEPHPSELSGLETGTVAPVHGLL